MIEWIVGHWTDVAQIIVGVVGVASIIVKLTPNVKDDAVLGKIKKFISNWLALNPKD